MNWIADFIAKLGFFFFTAMFFLFLEHCFYRYVQKKRIFFHFAEVYSMPLFTGIIMPILTLIFFSFPIGFPRKNERSYYEEIENHPAKIFALAGVFFLFIVFFIILKLFPSLIFWSDNLIIYFLVILTLFIVFNTLPFYPSTLSLWLIAFLRTHFLKKMPNDSFIRFVSFYKYFTLSVSILFIFLIVPNEETMEYWSFTLTVLEKIESFFNTIHAFPLFYFYIASGFLFLILIWFIIIYKRIFRYYQNILHNAIQKIIEERTHYD